SGDLPRPRHPPEPAAGSGSHRFVRGRVGSARFVGPTRTTPRPGPFARAPVNTARRSRRHGHLGPYLHSRPRPRHGRRPSRRDPPPPPPPPPPVPAAPPAATVLSRAGLVDRQVPAPEVPAVQGTHRLVGTAAQLHEGEPLGAVRVAVDDDLGREDLSELAEQF